MSNLPENNKVLEYVAFLHTVEKSIKLNIFLKINEYKNISIVILTY